MKHTTNVLRNLSPTQKQILKMNQTFLMKNEVKGIRSAIYEKYIDSSYPFENTKVT